MRKSLISIAALSVLFLAGCSEKNPEVDASSQQGAVEEQGTVVEESAQGVQEGLEKAGVSLSELQEKLTVVYFDFDKYSVRSDMQEIVDTDAEVLNHDAIKNSVVVKLEGNCDEFGTDEYNMALGLKRANSVKKRLVAQGVDADRISTVSYGKNNPVCTDKTQECYAKNRRVDFELYNK